MTLSLISQGTVIGAAFGYVYGKNTDHPLHAVGYGASFGATATIITLVANILFGSMGMYIAIGFCLAIFANNFKKDISEISKTTKNVTTAITEKLTEMAQVIESE